MNDIMNEISKEWKCAKCICAFSVRYRNVYEIKSNDTVVCYKSIMILEDMFECFHIEEIEKKIVSNMNEEIQNFVALPIDADGNKLANNITKKIAWVSVSEGKVKVTKGYVIKHTAGETNQKALIDYLENTLEYKKSN